MAHSDIHAGERYGRVPLTACERVSEIVEIVDEWAIYVLSKSGIENKELNEESGGAMCNGTRRSSSLDHSARSRYKDERMMVGYQFRRVKAVQERVKLQYKGVL
ncbi:hypothetical protein CC2G_003600 [Coprinopsis cinerea AmutBmut pab1-1]|nr:hypothetical protein CC2G_003600 [Coprinopsis cinerea AmutBmut pab1-1]